MGQKSRVPELRIHKATGQAYVLVEGRRIYLGRHDRRETQERYRRSVAELLATCLHNDWPSAPINVSPASV